MAFDGSGTGSPEKTRKQRTGLAPKQILATVLIVIAVVLGIENANRHTQIQLIGPTVDTHLWILVAAPLVLGLLAGLLLGHKSRKAK